MKPLPRLFRPILLIVMIASLAGCASSPFQLSDESAVKQLLTTKHVAELHRHNPSPFICWVEGVEPNARELYLGEDHPDHTVRIGSYRVTSDGRVWINDDATGLTERWVVIK
jgi:hypothetical protein